MKSRASIKSHPLHPLLIPFPIAFFTGTLLCHLFGTLLDKENLLITAYYLNMGGIAFALLAALPGLVDFVYTVPPKSSAKKRAAQHGIINVTMLAFFTIAFFIRRADAPDDSLLFILEGAGFILMCIAGWLGGTLVYRNQIGVDPRYANAGKWKEASFDQDTGQVEVATADELKINDMKLLHVKSRRIVLARTENGYVAFDDRCTHKGGSLAGGSTMCGVVQCPWHGSQFDVRTGAVNQGPAKGGINTYPVTESKGKIFLGLD